MSGPAIHELLVADDPARWRELGFDLDGDRFQIGEVGVRFVDESGSGVVGWSLRGAGNHELDGLPTTLASGEGGPPGTHPNGALQIDHIVVLTPDLERTSGAVERAGARLRRVREAGEVRQGFHRLGEVILEVVETPKANGDAAFWGLVFVVESLERCAALLGDRLGAAHDAVQRGRRIATVRRFAGLSVPVAFITPEPPR